MKIIYLFLLIFAGLFVKAQKDVLLGNNWFINRVIVNGTEYPFIPRSDEPSYQQSPTIFQNNEFSTYGTCNWLHSTITYLSDNIFYSTANGISLIECYPYEFETYYFDYFFQSANGYKSYTYKIESLGTAKVLTITNEKGDKAIYGSEKNMAVNNVSIQKLSLYPNPVKDKLIIKSDEKIEKVDIYSQTGQLVKTIGSKEVDTSDLPKGNYIVKIKTDKGTVIEKLIKN